MEHLLAYFKANRGKQRELATHLGLFPSTVSQWRSVPLAHVRRVSEFTDIPIEKLRPDLAKVFAEGAS